MKKILGVLFIIGFLLPISACKTMDINSSQAFIVPDELTQQDAVDAIVNSVNPEGTPSKLKQKKYFGPFSQMSSSQGFWYIEDVNNNSVIVGFDNGKHYFSTEYIVSDGKISKKILSSRNLKQSENSIHKAVFGWLGQLDSRIKQSMGYLASSKQKTNQ